MVTKYQKFGDGYKAEAVKLYRESNQTIAETARNLGLKESTLANWVKKDKDNEAVAAGERQLRVTAGYSQAALAERAGLSVDAVAALETGRRRHRPSVHTRVTRGHAGT